MRKLRFLSIAVISFVAALFGAFLSPSTWLHKSLAVALCGVLSANPALCTNNAIAIHSQEASAINPVKVETTQFSDLLAQRSRDFDDDTPKSPPRPNPNNPKPTFNRNDSGANIPVRRPDFDDEERTTPVSPQSNPNRKFQTPAFTGDSNVPCTSPVITSNNVEPGKEVIVKGIPQNYAKLSVLFQTEGSEKISPSIATRLSNGDVSIFVPLHPIKGALGGNTTVVISSNNQVCPKLNLTISPLTPSPGTTQKLLAKQMQILDRFSKLFGVSRDDLISTTNNFTPELVPLVVAQFILDHPRNPNSFKAILDGTSPLLNGQKPDISLLDGILANTEIISHLESLINQFPQLTSELNEFPNQTSILAVASNTKTKSVSNYGKSQYLSGDLVSFSLKKTLQDRAKTPEGLSQLCKLYDYADTAQNDPIYAGLKLAISVFLAGISLTGVGAVPALGASIGMFILDKVTKTAKFYLPSDTGAVISFQASPTNLDTEREKIGRWSNVELSTKSTGGNFDIGDLIDVILTMLDLKGFKETAKLSEVTKTINRLENAVENSKKVVDDARDAYFKTRQIRDASLKNPGTVLTTEQMTGVREAESNLQKAISQFENDRNALRQARQTKIDLQNDKTLSGAASMLSELRSFINNILEGADKISKTPIIPIDLSITKR